jgi:hypothetical protein
MQNLDPQEDRDTRNELVEAISEILESQGFGDRGFGYIPDHLAELMADAAMVVLMTVKDVDDYHIKEQTNFGG